MTIYCDKQKCIHHDKGICTAKEVWYVNRQCDSYTSAHDLMRTKTAKVQKIHGRYRQKVGEVLK